MVLGRLPVGQGDNNVQLSFGKCKNSKEDGHRKKKILKNIVNSPRQNSNLNFPKQDKKKI
jgi:hypothetical protein